MLRVTVTCLCLRFCKSRIRVRHCLGIFGLSFILVTLPPAGDFSPEKGSPDPFPSVIQELHLPMVFALLLSLGAPQILWLIMVLSYSLPAADVFLSSSICFTWVRNTPTSGTSLMRTHALLNMGIKQPGLGYATGKQAFYVSVSEFGFVKVILPQQDQLLLGHFSPEQ